MGQRILLWQNLFWLDYFTLNILLLNCRIILRVNVKDFFLFILFFSCIQNDNLGLISIRDIFTINIFLQIIRNIGKIFVCISITFKDIRFTIRYNRAAYGLIRILLRKNRNISRLIRIIVSRINSSLIIILIFFSLIIIIRNLIPMILQNINIF